jgi:ribonuclease P protein component
MVTSTSKKTTKEFPPERRVKRRTDFLRIQGAKTKFRAKHFLVAVERSKPELKTKIGITVTTKLSKRANVRNLLKRRIREIFRQGNVPPGFNFVVIGLNGSIDLEYKEIEEELCFVLRKAKRELLPRP